VSKVLENWLKKVSFVPTTTITFPHKEWWEGGKCHSPIESRKAWQI